MDAHMALTLGTTGMDSATEAELHAAFQRANAGSGNRWKLVGENDADYVVVDMDSMYGPMSWLRLHAAGKRVIGLTSAARTQTDYRLARPVDAAGVAALLSEISGEGGAAPAAPVAAEAAAVPSGMSPAPVPEDLLPEEHPSPVDEEAETPVMPHLPGSVDAGSLAPVTVQPAATPPRERTLGDWLGAGALSGRQRYQRGDGPVLLIDADARQYHGPAGLKPLAPYFEGPVQRTDFQAIDGADWTREAASLGAAQPLVRLQWYAGLLAGKGRLLPGFDATARYRLSKWPQTEREFPKHFRIATAMMKGPTTLDELAAASGVPLDEVVDFVNANLVTGFAEPIAEQSPEPTEPQKSGGLLGRLRGK
jgi:hypothetical protein